MRPMPSSSQWIAFLIASILFIQVPGPSLLFTIGRALTVGRREALVSVLGMPGSVCAGVGVAVGLGAVIATSATAYTVLKLFGAAYVVWLGVSAIRHRADARVAMARAERLPGGHGRALRTGFIVGFTNPKTIVFFVAFLPQFTNSAQAEWAADRRSRHWFSGVGGAVRHLLGVGSRARPVTGSRASPSDSTISVSPVA